MSIFGKAASLATAAIPGAGPVARALTHWKLIVTGIGFAILGGMLVFAKADARHWHKDSDNKAAQLKQADDWAASVQVATSHAADIRGKDGKPALLARNLVPIQIGYLGSGLVSLRQALDDKNRDSEARAAALAASRAENAADQRRLAALAKTDESRRQALEALRAGHAADPHCTVPPALAAQLKGL